MKKYFYIAAQGITFFLSVKILAAASYLISGNYFRPGPNPTT
jgi:hypothetical protein